MEIFQYWTKHKKNNNVLSLIKKMVSLSKSKSKIKIIATKIQRNQSTKFRYKKNYNTYKMEKFLI